MNDRRSFSLMAWGLAFAICCLGFAVAAPILFGRLGQLLDGLRPADTPQQGSTGFGQWMLYLGLGGVLLGAVVVLLGVRRTRLPDLSRPAVESSDADELAAAPEPSGLRLDDGADHTEWEPLPQRNLGPAKPSRDQ